MITLIIGLPGSGKTYLAKQMIVENKNIQLFDDISCKSGDLELMLSCAKDGKDCIITDPHLCVGKTKDAAVAKLSEYTTDIQLICFENCLSKARNNVQYRNDGRKISDYFMNFLSEQYEPENYVDKSEIKEIFQA